MEESTTYGEIISNIAGEEGDSDSSSNSASSSTASFVRNSQGTKRKGRAEKKAEMLQLALQAISRYKASQKRTRTSVAASKIPMNQPNTERYPNDRLHITNQSTLDTNLEVVLDKNGPGLPVVTPDPVLSATISRPSGTAVRDNVELGRVHSVVKSAATFVHPMLQNILTPVRKPFDFFKLPLPPPYLTGEGTFKCEICCDVFSSQKIANVYRTTKKHIQALNLLTVITVNYCNDVDVIDRLRERENRNEAQNN